MDHDDLLRERRQLDLMIERIEAFRAGRMEIEPTVNDLEALHYELASVGDSWVEEFREAWSDLEIPYAVALHRGDPMPTIRDLVDLASGTCGYI